MPLSDPINLRLSVEKRFLFEAEAAQQGQSLSRYLRQRLETEDGYLEEIQRLKSWLAERHPKPVQPSPTLASAATTPEVSQGLLIEMLLLLRLMAGPEKMLLAQRELKRLNIPLWKEPDHGT